MSSSASAARTARDDQELAAALNGVQVNASRVYVAPYNESVAERRLSVPSGVPPNTSNIDPVPRRIRNLIRQL